MPARKKKTAKSKSASKKSKARIYLFMGTDEAKVKEAALKCSQKIAPPDNEFGLEIVNGAADNTEHAARILAECMEAIQTLPFFGGEKVVWLQDANVFGDNVVGRSERTLKSIEALREMLQTDLPGNVQVIISALEMDKRRSFYKQIGKVAKVEAFDKIDISKDGWEAKVIGWASKEAGQLNLKFAPGALERLILTVGADTRSVRNELEKLSLYFGDREIHPNDISQVVASTHAGVVFEIGDAVANKDLPRALALIDKQLTLGKKADPVGILRAAIIPKIRGMLHAKDLMTRHRIAAGRNYRAFEAQINDLPESETAHLPRKKDGGISAYPIFLSAQSTRKFSVDQLINALEACLEADLRLVTTQLDPKTVLDQLVTRILTHD